MEQDEGCYLCLFNTFPDGSLTGRTCLQLYGLTAVIQTQQTVMAAVGEDVHLSCQLMESRDVLQVTWQKLSPDGKNKNLAGYDKDLGQGVNAGFQDKVEFKVAGLQNFSIVIKKVMEQDEGCYLCLFDTFTDGSLTGTTCLQLYAFNDESGSDKNFTLIVALITAVVVVCVAVVVTVLLRHKHKNSLSHRDAEEIKTPQKSIQDPNECETPLMKEENQQIWRQTSQEENPKEEKQEPSSSSTHS
ncbi:CD226 antigen-like [Thunnus albacares]|uniref:CD226 antigen-like n=1 Tax=Thunnus albacares TaxID=8236 RepID=UPI001CF61D60|nr:CD226 antigen-like [Thunnus albacares]